MTVLVTGDASHIGSHVVLALRDRGRPCVVVDDLSTGSRSPVPPDVELASGDVGDAALIGRLIEQHKITSIVHLVASTSVSVIACLVASGRRRAHHAPPRTGLGTALAEPGCGEELSNRLTAANTGSTDMASMASPPKSCARIRTPADA